MGSNSVQYVALFFHERCLSFLRQTQARILREALTLAKESLSIRRYLYGPKDQSVAASYGNIAILQIACGKYEEA